MTPKTATLSGCFGNRILSFFSHHLFRTNVVKEKEEWES